MGSGSWSSTSYNTYTSSTRGVTADAFSNMSYSTYEIYTSRHLDPMLDPKGITRLCRDNDEHPETLPVILALDVTGSMGGAATKVAQKLNEIMNELYANDNIHDIEFCCMAIGDLVYDSAPIQMTQFESDIRIAEQLDKVYFEAGGGGNKCESYSAAWYMGSRHCDLDCWKRNQKGIIITMGDELPDSVLPAHKLNKITGDHVQADIDTTELLEEAKTKFNIFHISVNDRESSYTYHQYYNIDTKWENKIGKENYFVSTLDSLPGIIVNIINSCVNNSNTSTNEGGIAW